MRLFITLISILNQKYFWNSFLYILDNAVKIYFDYYLQIFAIKHTLT